MSKSESYTDLTRDNSETYDSSIIARFSWDNNPLGPKGTLHVEFQSGEKYVYMKVPKALADELEDRANNPQNHRDSVGQFFYQNIRNEYKRKGQDYVRL
jgi:hypothetical protein